MKTNELRIGNYIKYKDIIGKVEKIFIQSDIPSGICYHSNTSHCSKLTIDNKNYTLDVEQAKKLGLLKEEDTRCKSWEEFCDKYWSKTGFYFDEANGNINTTENPIAFDEQLMKLCSRYSS